MVKIIILLLSFGLSTLTMLLLNLDAAWKIAVGIIGLGFAYVIGIFVVFFLIVGLFDLPIMKDKVSEKYSKFYRHIYTNCVRLNMSLFGVKCTVAGMNKLPKDTTFLLIQNHLSNIDPMLTNCIFHKYPLIFVSKDSLFKIPFFGKYIRKIGYAKLYRRACENDINEIARATKWLKEDQCSVGIYPEGTRNKSFPYPPLLDFHIGSCEIARKANKPIVVSLIRGSEHINDKLLLKVHDIRIDILDVITPEMYKDLSGEELTAKVKSIMLEEFEHPKFEKGKTYLF